MNSPLMMTCRIRYGKGAAHRPVWRPLSSNTSTFALTAGCSQPDSSLRIADRIFFSLRETCTCVMPSSCAVCVWVLPEK